VEALKREFGGTSFRSSEDRREGAPAPDIMTQLFDSRPG